ncbi:MAG: hypothetical protein GXY61_08180 [Lentisphaerae bacterium]|nr:hypothetical protein [Lentisphaerota bacterium]
MNDQNQIEYAPAKWVLILFIIFNLMAFGIPMISLIQSKPIDIVILYSFFMLPLCLIGIFGLISYFKTRIIFSGENVVYRGIYFDPIFHTPKITRWTGFVNEKVISLRNLQSVTSNGHYMILDTGETYKQLLPNILMFENHKGLITQLYNSIQAKGARPPNSSF